MMKNKIFLAISTLFLGTITYGQVRVQSDPEVSIDGQNPFLDASSYGLFGNNQGKGLYFPQTDLTTWEFKTDAIDPGRFSTYFDGMVVYNTTSGKTGTNPATQGQQVDVEPGFYYFYNPGQSAPMGNIDNGRWVRIGGDSSSSKAVDYKLGDAQPTGEFFWPDDQEAHKKPIMRKTIEVQFDDVTYADVTGMVPKDARFIKTQLVDKTTGKMLLASAEFKPNGGAEFGVAHTNDFFVAKYGQMSTTLNGTYTMILEYYVPN